jgi:gamma-glutamyltranspeptidase
VGYWLRQPDLARTFRLIAAEGTSAFYSGQIVPALLAAQTRTIATACEGRMTADDLANYEIKASALRKMRQRLPPEVREMIDCRPTPLEDLQRSRRNHCE